MLGIKGKHNMIIYFVSSFKYERLPLWSIKGMFYLNANFKH